MSTDAHEPENRSGLPIHQDVAFEARDVKSASVLKFIFYLALTIIAVLLVCWAIWSYTTARIARFDTPPPPVRQGAAGIVPPEPRLQALGMPRDYHDVDPQQDLRDKMKQDLEALEKTAWVDEKAGIAQISIEEAMTIVAEKGLGVVAPRRVEAVAKVATKK